MVYTLFIWEIIEILTVAKNVANWLNRIDNG